MKLYEYIHIYISNVFIFRLLHIAIFGFESFNAVEFGDK